MSYTLEIPWLHDRHSHASIYASFLGCPSLAGHSTEEALVLLRKLDPEGLSIVFGWHSALTPLAPRDLASLPPVVIVNLSMHGYALSDAALPLLEGGQPGMVEHRADTDWGERNLPRLLEFFGMTAGFTAAKFEAFMADLETKGLGSADDMLLPGEGALEVIQASRWKDQVQCWTAPSTFEGLSAGARAQVAGLKFFLDGALGSRSAALRGTFRDGRKGLLLYRDEELAEVLAKNHAHGKALAIHAIGDGAIEQVLGVLERLDREGLRFPLVRLEHVQFVDEIQARRARDLGLVLSMQPNFNSDSQDYEDRLEESWLAANNPFRILIDRAGFVPGKDLVFGSDGMPHGVEYALQWSLFPRYPGQRLTADELVAGYGAYGSGSSRLEIDPDAHRVKLVESRRNG